MKSGVHESKNTPKVQYDTTLASPGRQDHFRLELRRPVHDLGGEESAGERGPEDRGDSRAHAGRQQHAAIDGAQAQQGGEERTEAGADLGDGPFAAAGAAGADGDGAGEDLDERHAGPDLSLAIVVGGDAASVPCPSASGAIEKTRKPLRSPPIVGTTSRSSGRSVVAVSWSQPKLRLVGGPVGVIADDRAERVVDDEGAEGREEHRAESGDDADEDGRGEKLTLTAKASARELEKLGEPAERMDVSETFFHRDAASWTTEWGRV